MNEQELGSDVEGTASPAEEAAGAGVLFRKLANGLEEAGAAVGVAPAAGAEGPALVAVEAESSSA